MTENLPDWIKNLAPYFGTGIVGIIIGAILKYKSETKGYEVTDKNNEADHKAELVKLVKETLLNHSDDQKEEIKELKQEVKDLKATLTTVQNDNIAIRLESADTAIKHKHCESDIASMKEKIQSLIDGQALAERRHLEERRAAETKLREAEDARRELAIIAEGKLRDASEQDILDRIDRNTKRIEQLPAAPLHTHAASVSIQTDAVEVHTTHKEEKIG